MVYQRQGNIAANVHIVYQAPSPHYTAHLHSQLLQSIRAHPENRHPFDQNLPFILDDFAPGHSGHSQ